MATLGTVYRQPNGSMTGDLAMKSYTGRVLFAPNSDRRGANAPDFRIFGASDRGGRFEMGAAWIKTRADGQGTFVSVKLDYPELPTPVYATLGQLAGQDDDDLLAVIWNRPTEGRSMGSDPFASLMAAA